MVNKQLDQQLLESRFSTLIANLHEAVLVENEYRKIVLTNTAFCKMFAIPASPEQMIGQDCANAAEESKVFFVNPEEFVSRIEELLEAQKLVIGDKLKTIHGTYLERDYIPVFIDDRYIGHMWKYRDVTETQNLLSQITTKNEKLQQFGYTLTHDIKNPIRGIKNLISWIEEELKDNNLANDTIEEYINHIKNKVHVANKIIDGVIDYTFAENSESLFEFFEFKSVVEEITSGYTDNNISYKLNIDNSTKEGNKTKWRQSFGNLISNSIKYNDKDICEININISNGIITYWDNGPGIPEDQHEKMFNMFETLGKSKNSELSTGIGLAIFKKNIESEGYQV